MRYPCNECGECYAWLALEEPEGISRDIAYRDYCSKCELFQSQKFVRHIPSGCCYPLEDDGKTVMICGANLTPTIDGKIFWEYVDKYEYKISEPSNPYANH